MKNGDISHRKLPSRTKFLNFFRKPFTFPLLEKILVSMILKKPSPFLNKLFPEYYLYKKGTLRYATRRGINYKLDVSNYIDHYIFWGIADSGYTSILRAIKKSEVILDVGAYIGTTALFYASINSKAQILAFEPHPASFKKARVNILLNRFKNIRLMNLGLGERKKTLKLYEVNESNPSANRILTEEKRLPYKLITIDTLDSIMQAREIKKVDFIKIDVEGFEYEVLRGGARTIMQSKPILFIELDENNLRANNRSAKELIELLLSFGYKKIYRADNLMTITPAQEFGNCHYDIVAR